MAKKLKESKKKTKETQEHFQESWRGKVGIILIAYSSYLAIRTSNLLHFAIYAILIIILIWWYKTFIKWKNITKLAIITAGIITLYGIASAFIFGYYIFAPNDPAYEIGARLGLGIWSAIHYYFAIHTFMYFMSPFMHKE